MTQEEIIKETINAHDQMLKRLWCIAYDEGQKAEREKQEQVFTMVCPRCKVDRATTQCPNRGGIGDCPMTAQAQNAAPVSAEAIRSQALEEAAKVCDARYMGDNNREDMETKRCAAAIRNLK